MARRPPLAALILIGALLALPACAREAERPPAAVDTLGERTTAAATAAGTPAPATAPPPAQALDAPVHIRLAWLVEQVNDHARALSEADVHEGFRPEFLAAVPPAQVIASTRQFADRFAPVAFESFLWPPSATQAAARYTTRTGDGVVVEITVEAAVPHRIVAATLRPAPPPAGGPVAIDSWDDLDRALEALTPQVNFLAAELVAGDCRPVHALDAGRRLALGSTFKLYVLGALAAQVRAGTAAWDEELALRDDYKSLPSGTLQDEPAGRRYPLRAYAARMIAVSDNTATDHLLFRLGREQVEAQQAAMGHGDPTRNIPFLSTREMFVLKLALPDAQVDAYLAAPVAEKRRLLEAVVARAPLSRASAAGWIAPRRVESLEWFASAEELCRAMAALQALSEQPGLEPVAEVLALNRGASFDRAAWPYVGFKGGAELGVLNLTWLLRRADGRWFVLTFGLNDPAHAFDQAGAFRLIDPAARLLVRAD